MNLRHLWQTYYFILIITVKYFMYLSGMMYGSNEAIMFFIYVIFAYRLFVMTTWHGVNLYGSEVRNNKQLWWVWQVYTSVVYNMLQGIFSDERKNTYDRWISRDMGHVAWCWNGFSLLEFDMEFLWDFVDAEWRFFYYMEIEIYYCPSDLCWLLI